MSLEVGDRAPDFSLPADGGSKSRSRHYKGKPVVLYFYPKDDTSGCTRRGLRLPRRAARLQQGEGGA